MLGFLDATISALLFVSSINAKIGSPTPQTISEGSATA